MSACISDLALRARPAYNPRIIPIFVIVITLFFNMLTLFFFGGVVEEYFAAVIYS